MYQVSLYTLSIADDVTKSRFSRVPAESSLKYHLVNYFQIILFSCHFSLPLTRDYQRQVFSLTDAISYDSVLTVGISYGDVGEHLAVY